MSNIAFTSRLEYRRIKEDLRGLQLEVWTAIRNSGELLSIEDLARLLNRKESSICGRINELRGAGAIEDGPLKNQRGHAVKSYRAVVYRAYEVERRELARARDREPQLSLL